MSVQLLITSDNHLDPSAISFGAKRFERKQDHLRCFEELIDYAKMNRPDFLLMGGDVFDTIKPGNFIRARLMEHLKTMHEIGVRVLIVSGHHDTPKSAEEGVSPLAVYGNSGYAHFFKNPSQLTARTFNLPGLKVVVAGLSHNPLLEPAQDPLVGLRAEVIGDVNILLVHYPIEGFVGIYGDEPVIKLASIPRQFQLVAAGHFHGYQTKRLAGTTIVCPGSTERVSFIEENEPKGFVWAELGKDGIISVEHIKTSARPYRTLELPFPKEDPIATLKRRLDEDADAEVVFRLRLKGRVTAEQLSSYRRSELLLYAQEKFFHLSIDESGLQPESPEPLEALPQTKPLEELRRYFKLAIEQAPEEEREIIEEALRLSEARLQEAGAW